jgi:hypothetical protein
LDAKLEIEYLLEYLGVTGGRNSSQGHRRSQKDKEEHKEEEKKRHKEGDKERHKKGHKKRHHKDGVANGGSGLMAARDRFSNIQINDVEDGRSDRQEDSDREEHINDNESVFV